MKLAQTLLPSPTQAMRAPRSSSPALFQRLQVRHDLAGMGPVGQAVDDGNGGKLGKRLDI
jgi:hypothetical protein